MLTYRGNHFTIYLSQIIMLYTENLYSAVCQANLGKTGRSLWGIYANLKDNSLGLSFSLSTSTSLSTHPSLSITAIMHGAQVFQAPFRTLHMLLHLIMTTTLPWLGG